MSENVKNFIDSVQNKDYTAAKDMFQGVMAEKISAAFENKKIELASQMTEGTQINEGTYDVPWMDEWTDRDIKKWERKYKISITVKRDDNASISGKDSDIKKFVTKELDFEEPELEMMGLKESTRLNERAYDVPWTDDSWDKNISKWERRYKVTIKTRDDNATVSGKDSDIEKFLTKELDFEEQDLEMIGLK